MVRSLLFFSILPGLAGAGTLDPALLDQAISAHWTTATSAPAPVADEATLLRRVLLDLTGRMPDPVQVRGVLSRDAPLDLPSVVERGLRSPEFAVHWARVIRTWLTGRQYSFQTLVDRSLDEWLRDRLASGRGLDRVVTELITAQGTVLDHPEVSYLLQFRESKEDMAGHVARTFLGAQIQCAQCHDHPFDRWKQADFQGFAALFDGMRVPQWPRPIVEEILAGKPMSAERYIGHMPDYVRSGFRPGSPAAARIESKVASLPGAGSPRT